jgi:hypothetical protein
MVDNQQSKKYPPPLFSLGRIGKFEKENNFILIKLDLNTLFLFYHHLDWADMCGLQ